MGLSDLPDICTLKPEGLQHMDVHNRQITMAHDATDMSNHLWLTVVGCKIKGKVLITEVKQ